MSCSQQLTVRFSHTRRPSARITLAIGALQEGWIGENNWRNHNDGSARFRNSNFNFVQWVMKIWMLIHEFNLIFLWKEGKMRAQKKIFNFVGMKQECRTHVHPSLPSPSFHYETGSSTKVLRKYVERLNNLYLLAWKVLIYVFFSLAKLVWKVLIYVCVFLLGWKVLIYVCFFLGEKF